jgi:hypothetical protein
MTLRSISLMLILCVATRGYAQQDSLRLHQESGATVIATDVALFVPASILFIMNHELGHYAMASAFGGHNVRFGLVRTKADGGHQLGWTDWDNSLSGTGTTFAALGGVVFSRGLAEESDCLVKNVSMPPWTQRFFSITFLLGRFDFARYVLMDALEDLGGRQGSDMATVARQIGGVDGGSRAIVYVAMAGIALADLLLDWDRVAVYWGILTGTPYHRRQDTSRIQVSPVFAGGPAGVRLTLEF